MNEIEKVKIALEEAANYFSTRGFITWEKEARESIDLINKGNTDVIKTLYLKYAPTCEVEGLFITEYKPEEESKVNELNEALADIIN